MKNKYIDLIEKHSQEYFKPKFDEICNRTKHNIQECEELYYNENTRRQRKKLAYEQGLQEVYKYKEKILISLQSVLQTEKEKIQNEINNTTGGSVNELILNELVKLNKFNSFKTLLDTMNEKDIMDMYTNSEAIFNIDQVNLMRSRVDAKDRDKIQFTNNFDLMQRAEERLEAIKSDENYFPGMGMGHYVAGGIPQLLGEHLVVGENNYFNDDSKKQMDKLEQLKGQILQQQIPHITDELNKVKNEKGAKTRKNKQTKENDFIRENKVEEI